jgi:hypothetical protein
MTKGIIVADENKNVDDRAPLFDSRRPRMQAAIDRTPPHMGVVDLKPHALTSNAGNGYYSEETLVTISHNLLYKPKVLIYFLVLVNYGYKSYNVGKFFYSFGAIDDYLTVVADINNVTIKHILNDYIEVGYTSTNINDYIVKAKYLILSVPVDQMLFAESGDNS